MTISKFTKNVLVSECAALNNGSVLSSRVQQFSSLPDDALMSANEVSLLSGRSRTSIWRDVKGGLLPKPTQVGPNAVRWRVIDVRGYLNGEWLV